MSDPFKASRAEGWLQADFAEPAFELFKEIPTVYRQLFARLNRFGLSLGDMQPDLGGRALGDFELVCFLFGFTTTVKLRLDRVEIRCTDLINVEEKILEEIAVQALEIAATVSKVSFKTYGVALTYHGIVTGIKTREFLARFTREEPNGLGPAMGSAAAFYYGAESAQIASAVNIDLSAIVGDALYLRSQVTWDAAKIEIGSLPEIVRTHRDRVLDALGLHLE